MLARTEAQVGRVLARAICAAETDAQEPRIRRAENARARHDGKQDRRDDRRGRPARAAARFLRRRHSRQREEPDRERRARRRLPREILEAHPHLRGQDARGRDQDSLQSLVRKRPAHPRHGDFRRRPAPGNFLRRDQRHGREVDRLGQALHRRQDPRRQPARGRHRFHHRGRIRGHHQGQAVHRRVRIVPPVR